MSGKEESAASIVVYSDGVGPRRFDDDGRFSAPVTGVRALGGHRGENRGGVLYKGIYP